MASTAITKAHQGLSNKWKGILEQEGISPKVLNGRHQACPICNGKDRFRFDDKGIGRWYCNQCGAGDGIKLLMLVKGIAFPEALHIAQEAAGFVAEAEPAKERDTESKRKSLVKVWNASHPDDPALEAYFLSRGLPPDLAHDKALRWHPMLEWHAPNEDGDKMLHGSHPAMVARYYQWDKHGKAVPVTVHRTWPTGCPKKRMVMSPVVNFEGIFCPLGGMPVNGEMGIAEGIESALGLRGIVRLSGAPEFPVWAVYSAEEMKKFNPPRGIQLLHIGIDIDYSWTGQAAGYELARRLRTSRPEIDVRVVRPTPDDRVDWDFNDQLQKLGATRERLSVDPGA